MGLEVLLINHSTLEIIGEKGVREFYEGDIGK
jgi:gamma-glutamyltranspeptidase